MRINDTDLALIGLFCFGCALAGGVIAYAAVESYGAIAAYQTIKEFQTAGSALVAMVAAILVYRGNFLAAKRAEKEDEARRANLRDALRHQLGILADDIANACWMDLEANTGTGDLERWKGMGTHYFRDTLNSCRKIGDEGWQDLRLLPATAILDASKKVGMMRRIARAGTTVLDQNPINGTEQEQKRQYEAVRNFLYQTQASLRQAGFEIRPLACNVRVFAAEIAELVQDQATNIKGAR